MQLSTTTDSVEFYGPVLLKLLYKLYKIPRSSKALLLERFEGKSSHSWANSAGLTGSWLSPIDDRQEALLAFSPPMLNS